MIDEDAAIKINGRIMPEFNHLKSLIFLLIILAIFPESLICKLTIKFIFVIFWHHQLKKIEGE